MDWKLELVTVPVTDVDRAKAFYVERAGFVADHDHTVDPGLRFVQLTPPGSACSIAIGTGLTDTAPGTANCQIVVSDVDAAREELLGHGLRGGRGAGVRLGPVRLLRRPGRQPLGCPAAAQPALNDAGRLRPYERLVSDPVRLVGLGAEPLAAVLLVLVVGALEPDDLGVTLESQDVRRHPVEKPAIVGDHDRAAGEREERLLER